VVDKPAGLVVHPGRCHHTGTLVNGLVCLPGFEGAPVDEGDAQGALRPGIVHRIDKDTSGLLVVAKSAGAREGLKRQFSEHSIERAYVAFTVGVPQPQRIESLHGRHPTQRVKFTANVRSGRRAVTHVALSEAFGQLAAAVRCSLETGRTHQIRVHLSEVCRTPILADELYGRASGHAALRAIGVRLGRQALHAELLGFIHPITGDQLRFESALPEDMAEALAALRALRG